MDKSWKAYAQDRNDFRRNTMLWSVGVVACAVLAYWFNKFIAIGEVILVPVLIANIRESGRIRRDRNSLVNSSENLLRGAREQLLIQAMLRRQKVSEDMEE